MNTADSDQQSHDGAGPLDPEVADVLRDPAALWQAVQQTSGEYIAVLDPQGIIRGCNRVDEGFTIDQVVGQSLQRFAVPESAAEFTEILRQVLASGEMRTLETTVRRLDGELAYFLLRVSPIRRDGRTVAVMACCENIRLLKHSEQALTRERNVLRRLLEIQERERQLVSYEIHDGLSQYLAGAIMHFQAWEAALGDHSGREELHEGMRLLQAAADESRRLISGLRPPALDELGIVEAIESLVSDARAEVPHVAFEHSLPGPRLPTALETAIFRIVQESLANVRRHATAEHATVEVAREGGVVRIRIQDDGCGFDPALVPEDRFGLEGIRQRSRLFGGESRIASSAGWGTTVDVVLPVSSDRP